MCGICGILNLGGDPVSSSVLTEMTNAMIHRGPDDEGYFVTGSIGLGHRRLAILDISTRGKQPMWSKNRKWVIVFNGFIYNYKELKKELIDSGLEFSSTTDTEVIAEGLAVYGPSYFERLNGMFAIAAWNTEERALYLSRDRFGIKPLYYWFDGKKIVFASEIKAILKHPDYHVALNFDALNEYFTFQNQFRYHTLFKDIILLPQANTVRMDHNSNAVYHRSWWDYNFYEPDEKMTYHDAVEETKRLLVLSVSKQIVADVSVGAYLSGGMDSGSITAIASKSIPRLKTFTAGFELSEVEGIESTFDERMDAELIANHFKTEHYEQVINAGDLSWSLPKVIWHIEDLKMGMSYPNYYISRLASKFVKVALQGSGGDELFGGYPWRYYRVLQSLNQKKFLDNYYGFWQRLVADSDRNKKLFTDDVLMKRNITEPRDVFDRVFTFNENLKYNTPEEQIQNSLYFEIKTFLPGLLNIGDKLSMANSLEERYPFLDNDLVDFTQKVPVRYKLADLENMKKVDENSLLKYRECNDGKRVLRKAMEDFLPQKILNRKKQGFSAPDESWYRGENANYIKELLLNSKTVSTEFINKKFIEQIINQHMNKRINHRLLLWSFMSFEWWCRLFLNNTVIEDHLGD